jgi:ribosome-associated toxin RatA of RatAB toxin-antitoxin module
MPTVTKSVLVPQSAERMFALVDDIESYPQFLPWCPKTTVYERTGEVTRARIDIDYHGLKTHFTTRNRKHAPTRMDMEFVEGPFEQLSGRWRFVQLGEDGCRVEFELDYAFEGKAMEALFGPVFGRIIETLVDRFVAQAEKA